MSTVQKKKLADGTVIIECPKCLKWRHYSAFLVGKDTRDPASWVPICAHCSGVDMEYLELGMPRDANKTDKAKDCGCGDGQYRSHMTGLVMGRCFRCIGKSFQDWNDVVRNYRHDCASARRSAMCDTYSEPEVCDPEVQDQINEDRKVVHWEDSLDDLAKELGI